MLKDKGNKMKDRYLGDGVYASFDGYQIILDLRAQDSTTKIALESSVLTALNRYVSDIQTENEKGE